MSAPLLPLLSLLMVVVMVIMLALHIIGVMQTNRVVYVALSIGGAITLGAAAIRLARETSDTFESKQRERKQSLASRDPIPLNEIYARFYAQSGLDRVEVLDLWGEVAKVVCLDPERMRPTDRFDRDYTLADRWMRHGDDLEDLEMIVNHRCKSRGMSPFEIETLDDYIRAFAGIGRL